MKRDTERGKSTSVEASTPHWSRRTMLITAIAVVSIVALIAVGAFYFASSTRSRINSVAVLPFSNASGDPSTEYMSDGITEGIIDRLSGIPDLKVISRTSAFRYKKRDIDPQKVARELGVEALVTGRVLQRGDDLSVTAELVDAREDKQLWGEQYSRKTRRHGVCSAGDRNSYILQQIERSQEAEIVAHGVQWAGWSQRFYDIHNDETLPDMQTAANKARIH